jgi:hypothetical protein
MVSYQFPHISQSQNAAPKDPALYNEVNNTLLRLVQEAKDRLEAEKSQASKSHTPAPIRLTPLEKARGQLHQGSVHPARPARPGHSEYRVSLLLDVDDENNNDAAFLQAENPDDSDERSESSSNDDVAIEHTNKHTASLKDKQANVYRALSSGPTKRQEKISLDGASWLVAYIRSSDQRCYPRERTPGNFRSQYM